LAWQSPSYLLTHTSRDVPLPLPYLSGVAPEMVNHQPSFKSDVGNRIFEIQFQNSKLTAIQWRHDLFLHLLAEMMSLPT